MDWRRKLQMSKNHAWDRLQVLDITHWRRKLQMTKNHARFRLKVKDITGVWCRDPVSDGP